MQQLDEDAVDVGRRAPRLIINADDFGRSREINVGVIRAHRDGVLTSASLMVTGDACEEAVALARENPTLAVGLHVVLVKGRSALPPSEIPHLVDAGGRFPDSPFRAGLRYATSRASRRELARELAAQFDRFAATGLPLSHVDGHLHMHVHPLVLPLVLPLAEQYGACGVRVPRDRLRLSLRADRRRAATRVLWAAVFSGLCRSARRRLRRYDFAVPSRCYGLMHSGNMNAAYVSSVLRQVREELAELHFHPTAGPRTDELGPNPGDLESLLSPAVKGVIAERGLELTTYSAAHRAARSGRRLAG